MQRIFSIGMHIHTLIKCGTNLDKHTQSDKPGRIPCILKDMCNMSFHTYMICETQTQPRILKHTIPYKHLGPYLSISWPLLPSDCSADLLFGRLCAHCCCMTVHSDMRFGVHFSCKAFNHHYISVKIKKKKSSARIHFFFIFLFSFFILLAIEESCI